MKMYGVFALILALVAPIFWTIGIYAARVTFDKESMSPWDVALDATMLGNMVFTGMFFIYHRNNAVDWREFMEGTIAGFLMSFGRVMQNKATAIGPGGPI